MQHFPFHSDPPEGLQELVIDHLSRLNVLGKPMHSGICYHKPKK